MCQETSPFGGPGHMPRGQEFGGLRPLFRTHGAAPTLHGDVPARRSKRTRSTLPPPDLLLSLPLGVSLPGEPGVISGNSGLVSAGRIDKDTPPLTTPSHASKSSAMDISSRAFKVVIHGEDPRIFRPRPSPPSRMTRGPRAYLYSCNKREGKISPLSGTDSDLEAFSHYPADGSFAALPGRAAAKTNYLNQRFLSY